MKVAIVLSAIFACTISVTQSSTTVATSVPTTAITETTTADKNPGVESGEEKLYFTEQWRKLFSEKQLKNQPKWFLTEDQPANGAYQVRKYTEHWIARFTKKCQTVDEAAREGYMDLYFYFNGFNFQRQTLPMTYPILFLMDRRLPKTPKVKMPLKRKQEPKVKPCQRYVTQLYIPIPIEKWAPEPDNSAIKTFKRAEPMFYVREYQGNMTTEYCAQEAENLAADLSSSGKKVVKNLWICARYEAPAGSKDPKLEVWIKK